MTSKYSQFSEEQKERCREANRNWARRNPRKEYYKTYDEERYDSRTPSRMFISARSRAKEANLPFDIELSDIVIPPHCPICQTELRSAKGIRGGSRSSPTLDRIVGDRGYTKNNIAVICKNCNSIKGHGTSTELRVIADWIDANSQINSSAASVRSSGQGAPQGVPS